MNSPLLRARYASVLPVLVFAGHICSGEKRALALARHEEVCMRIAIIGAGSVGATVGRAWLSSRRSTRRVPAIWPPIKPLMLVAGDDAGRKPVVMELVGKLGFEAVDAGPLKNARLLEPLAM